MKGICFFVCLFLAACQGGGNRQTGFDRPFPLPIPEGRSMLERWAQKPVLDSLLLDDMEGPMRWKALQGEMVLTLTGENARDGGHALRYSGSLRNEAHIAADRTPWGSFAGEQGGENYWCLEFEEPQDWSAWNRLSVWVYVHSGANKVVPLAIDLENEGTLDRTYTPSRETNLDLEPGRWQQVLWEIDYYPRDRIRRVVFLQTQIGHEPEGEPGVTIDIDRLQLQKVTPDHYEGWDLPEDGLAYAHTGYRPEDRKEALAKWSGLGEFTLLDAGGKAVFSAPARKTGGKGGDFALLDFSAFRRPGRYTLSYGEALSQPFPIADDVWLQPLFGALNFFWCQRCGYPVPGIHGVCHQDTQGFSGSEKRVVNGGWHDAGDLSQGFWRTGMGVFALLRALDATEGVLHGRVADEARWGLEYLLRVRFPQGRHITWTKGRLYSDNVPGTADDVVAQAVFDPFENYLGASVFLEAARRQEFKDMKTALLQAAREDWEATQRRAEGPGSLWERAWGAYASARLYESFGEAPFREAALHFADGLLASLEPRPRFFHAAFEEAPMIALRQLCRTFPEQSGPWKAAARAYMDDFIKPGCRQSAPYDLPPMGIDRTFPVWVDHVFHGAGMVQLSFTWAMAEASALLEDREGMDLVRRQLEWTLGRNPFCSSFMYGIGYNYAPNFVYCSHHTVGAIPVGIDSLHDDLPFWNGTASATAHEVWVEPVGRFVGALATFLNSEK